MGKRKVSIVIPLYNEEKILETAVNRLKKDLDQFRDEFDFEIILAENGSTDRTIEKGGELSKIDSSVSIFHYEHPDYGLALQEGIRRAGGEIIVCDEIDLCLPNFMKKPLLNSRTAMPRWSSGQKERREPMTSGLLREGSPHGFSMLCLK